MSKRLRIHSLQPWVREHRNCPLCKKACTQQKILSPLYLSSDDEQTQAAHADTSEDMQVLQLQLLQLRQEKETAQQRFNMARQELMDERVKSQTIASDLRGATKAIRHMKQIRRERDDAVRKSSLLERSNLHLEKKLERLKNKLQLAEAAKQAATALPKPRRTGNVIVLDDSDEDNDSNDDDQPLEDDSDGPVVIAESNNNQSRMYDNGGDNFSSRQTLKRQHSLLSDTEDDFAIEEHRHVYVYHDWKYGNSLNLPF
ncbi:hypothetical protein MUCCIDRAFT_105117 [Mucor lusitanicus CBS 277.49]|uniref:Uncharacterized protein n=1 Tax=Mucor lusitanicus CBS 277.49 TaxID=747725 RepID=A0A168PSR4_MUCCL|nr:hypothetical protein MUCCIDRAFT_105117 [Mucor lusitanicus CBS 277.49]